MTQEAFLSLITPMQEKLFRFVYYFVGNEEEAKDLVQDAIVKIWEKRAVLQRAENPEAWCMRVTKNLMLDKIKYNRYRTAMPIVNDTEYIQASANKPPIELNDTIYIIRKLINDLPEKSRILLQLRDIEGFEYREIADITSLSLSEVKVGIFRARKIIRQQIQKLTAYGLR